MGRHRSIDREGLLDAAESVAAREGAAGLTIEAVAQEARISKASVLYDYKTKRALIAALIDRRLKAEAESQARFASAYPHLPDPIVHARIESARLAVSERERAIALGLVAALAGDATLREPIQSFYRASTEAIRAGASRPREAMLAFLATEGLLLAELFGLHRWEPDERETLLCDIESLLTQADAAEPASASTVPACEPARQTPPFPDRDR